MEAEQLKEIVAKHPEEVRHPYGSLLKRMGYEALYAFLEEFGGSNVYVPSVRTVFYDCIVEQLKADFDGGNYRELCKKYGFVETTVRKILR